ncbi:MAG: fatty acid--CoA ligase [Deltaproteobacteria bacterium]|nr:fatty acid--CoA ligase [Deltaproteobacteria bacterium]
MNTVDFAQMTIPRVVARSAALWPDVSALEDGDVKLTFSELAEAGQEACQAFIAAGVEHGDRVAIWAPNGWCWVVAAIGLQSAGAVLVTLNTRFKPTEAAYVLARSGAKLLCTVGDFLGTNYADSLAGLALPALSGIVLLQGTSRNGIAWSDFLAKGAAIPLEQARERADAVVPEDLCDFLFTSGTTGSPKAVMSDHGQNMKVFDVWGRTVGLRAGDRYLIINPFFHSFGYKGGWLSALIHGATALPHGVFDVEQVLARVQKEKITVMPGPPAIYQSMLSFEGRDEYDTSSLRLAVTGAAPTPVELVRRMRDELGFQTVIKAYGLTESTGTVSICKQGDSPERIANSDGCAIPDTEVKCVDASGKEVPRGEPGEVWVRGYNVMRGYFNDEAETAKAIDGEGWLHTGDIAVMDEDGYIKITDRIKDMFIMGGFNVYPAEVENLLFQHETIAAAAVIGVPDERMGEVGMAFVVPVPGASLESDAVIAWSRENMANYKVPRFVEIVDELPINPSGKVLKNELRERAKATLT